jgi:hypothetical protein
VDLYDTGKKLCRLVAGGVPCFSTSSQASVADETSGTLHIVFLIALANLKSTVRNMRISEVNDVARLLRDPSSTCSLLAS